MKDELITYLRISAARKATTPKISVERLTISIADAVRSAYSHSFKTAEDLIKYWDTKGKGYGRYRYFLLSKNIPLEGR